MKLVIHCACALCFVLISCREDITEPSLRGDLIGRISTVLDEFGKPIADRSGYEVLVEGSDPERKVISDSDGKFLIEELPSGTYHLVFTKPGFQTRKVFSYQFTGGAMPTYYDAPLLAQLSTTSIANFNAVVTNENNPDTTKYTGIKIEFEIDPVATQTNPRTVITYIGLSDKVSSVDYEYQLNDPGYYKFSKWASGTKLYAIGYPAPVSCNAYYDPEKDQFINSCLGEPSGIVELAVP